MMKRTSHAILLKLMLLSFCVFLTLSLSHICSHAASPQEESERALTLFSEGETQFKSSNFRGAIQKWEAALSIFQTIGFKKGIGLTSSKIGISYHRLDDYRKAIGYYEKALAIAEETKDKQDKLNALGNLGVAYNDLSDYKKAVSYFEKTLAVTEEIGDKQSKGSVLGSLGNAYLRLGDYSKAIGYYEKALAIHQETGDKRSSGLWLGNLGIACSDMGDYPKAVNYLEKALAIAEETGDMRRKGLVLGNLGGTFLRMYDYRKAINYLEKALAIAEETGDKYGKEQILGNLGNAYSGLGDYQRALIFEEKALAIAEEIGDKQGKGTALVNLGNAYSHLGDYRKAIGYYEKAIAIAGEIGEKLGLENSLGNLGVAYSNLGDYRKAIDYYEKAIDIGKKIGVPYLKHEGNMGDAYLALDRDSEAFAIYTKLNHSIRLGRYYLKKKNFGKAKEQFERDREADETAKVAPLIIPEWIGLGLSLEGLKEYDAAYTWFKKAVSFMEEQRESLIPSEREHYFEGNEFGIPRIEAYKGAARCAFMLNRFDEAFYWSENTRGRIFAELLSGRHSGENYKIPPQLAQEEEALAAQIMINKKKQQAGLGVDYKQLMKRLELLQIEKEYPVLKQKMESLIDRLRKEYPQYASIRYPQPVKLSQLALKEGEVLIEYEVTEPYTIGLVIRKGKVVKAFKVDKSRKELEAMVARFRTPFQDGGDMNEFRLNLAKSLADLLITPVLPEVKKGEHLIIVPDEFLSLLPFEALLLNAPAEILKEEATLLAQMKKQEEGGTVDRRAIIRGLGKTTATRGRGVTVASRVSTHILFETGSAQISKESGKQMEEIIAALKSKELNNARIRIEGHTDSIGDSGYNLKLSRRRAEAVCQYLKKGGIKDNLLNYTGKGDTEPVADNATEQGRKRNRRVDFIRALEKKDVKSAASVSLNLVYVIDKYPISYYQSASVLSLQRGLHISRMKTSTFFGLGDPVFDTQDNRSAGMRSITITAKKDAASTDITGSEEAKDAGYHFNRLENTAKEVKEVSSLFPDSRVLLGPDASKSNLKKEDLTSRRYVLFSTHGILGNEIPYIKQPALVLNLVGNKEEDGFLTASEIFNMNMNADLVGLSACQTGLGIQSAGEGVVGLSRAFMYAGTDSVLVSLWSVSDESTYKLMIKFFAGLKQGKDKLTALQEAKYYLRTSGYDNPFYWAPFILVGEAN
jgi:CHAT domain-containing protein/Tfp pilus assembly protein PilF